MIYILMTLALGTYLTRVIPFLFFKHKEIHPSFMRTIDALPYATISLLVVYCFKDVGLSTFVPTLIASVICIVTYVWKSNTVLSIALSTFIYMMLI